MEDQAFRKGLSVTAIILIALSALALSLSNVNGILYGYEASFFGIPFVAAFAVPLLTVLIILTRFYTGTDTMEEMIAAIAVRYSIFGWFFVFLIKFAAAMLKMFCYDFYSSNFATVYLLMNSFNVCVVGTLVLAIALRKLPSVKIEKKKMRFGQLFLIIMMMYGLTQVGSMMGVPLDTVLSLPSMFNTGSEDVMKELQNNVILSSGTLVRTISVGILPAVFEELLFRKFLIDRTIRHGEFISCAMSGIMFGLWHGNFQQFFFAFFVGVLFAFVYIRTGNIIYTMILHASMNLVTSLVTVELLSEFLKRSGFDIGAGAVNEITDYNELISSVLPVFLLILLWLLILIGFQIAGFVLLIVKRKNFKLVAREGEPGRKAILHRMTHSVEMWIFFSFALLLFVYAYLPDNIAAVINLLG
ncbi:MAG: CPBP family intramembrane metalloprotease [Clostridiales bacterium]|nr:CPBP family intramembrane metalloprotease [Clostridiales bacterium]